jgi:D-methionine transport system ATP-binding protein
MIRIESVSKIYKVKEQGGDVGDFYALKNVSLSVEDGSIYGVIGRSGAGKSTLIRCVNLLERPTSGKVFIDDTDMTLLDGHALRAARRKIGMIFQSFNLLSNRTAYRNIAFPLELNKLNKKDIDARVREIAALVGIDDKLDHYPSQLSGGQKQRVGIARALANSPDVLLSDEATSALDPQTTKSVLALLRDINKKLGLTIILITHEMNVIKEICDSVAVIENGEIVEEGAVMNVFTNPRESVTKDLVASVMNTEMPESFANLNLTHERPSGEADVLLQLSFFGDIAAEPVMERLVRGFDVSVNILVAHIDHIRNMPYGTMIIQISGGGRDEALETLLDMRLRVEVIGYVSRSCGITH